MILNLRHQAEQNAPSFNNAIFTGDPKFENTFVRCQVWLEPGE
jgi:hypothetical protein